MDVCSLIHLLLSKSRIGTTRFTQVEQGSVLITGATSFNGSSPPRCKVPQLEEGVIDIQDANQCLFRASLPLGETSRSNPEPSARTASGSMLKLLISRLWWTHTSCLHPASACPPRNAGYGAAL